MVNHLIFSLGLNDLCDVIGLTLYFLFHRPTIMMPDSGASTSLTTYEFNEKRKYTMD